MLKKCIDKATLTKVILTAIAFSVMYAVINFSAIGVAGLLKITNGANILDFEFGYSAEKAYSMLTALGAGGRSFYLTRIIPLDFLFPVTYMLFYSCAICFSFKKITGAKSFLYLTLLFPLPAMLFDWMENICVIIMLKQYPLATPVFYYIGNYMTILKFIFTLTSIAVTVLLALTAIVLRVKRVKHIKVN